MRISPIAPVFLGAALLAVACSRPGEQTGDQQSQRDIRLIEEPNTNKPTVSDLEAGKTPPPVSLPEARPRSAELPAAEPMAAPSHDHAAMLADLEPEATMRVVTQDQSPAPTAETALPAATGPASGGEADSAAGLRGSYGSGGSRGPMILIRGGMGTERDDCKIHGVGGLGGGGGGGIAINRVTPPFRLAGGNRRSFSGGGGPVRIR